MECLFIPILVLIIIWCGLHIGMYNGNVEMPRWLILSVLAFDVLLIFGFGYFFFLGEEPTKSAPTETTIEVKESPENKATSEPSNSEQPDDSQSNNYKRQFAILILELFAGCFPLNLWIIIIWAALHLILLSPANLPDLKSVWVYFLIMALVLASDFLLFWICSALMEEEPTQSAPTETTIEVKESTESTTIPEPLENQQQDDIKNKLEEKPSTIEAPVEKAPTEKAPPVACSFCEVYTTHPFREAKWNFRFF